jgi:hypothetical protein
VKTFHQTAANMKKGSEWPVFPGCHKTTLTKMEAEQLENWKMEILRYVDEMFPEYEVGDIKPRHDTDKL